MFRLARHSWACFFLTPKLSPGGYIFCRHNANDVRLKNLRQYSARSVVLYIEAATKTSAASYENQDSQPRLCALQYIKLDSSRAGKLC